MADGNALATQRPGRGAKDVACSRLNKIQFAGTSREQAKRITSASAFS
jgi:hypothetical protein